MRPATTAAFILLLLASACTPRSDRRDELKGAVRRPSSSSDVPYLAPLPSIEHVRRNAGRLNRPVIRNITGVVEIQTSSGTMRYSVHLVDVVVGTTYESEIVYPGGNAGQVTIPSNANRSASRIHTARATSGLVALIRDNPDALVMNGGFSSSDAFHPAGLLLIDGRVESPFNFFHYGSDAAKPLRLAAVVCSTRAGHIDFLSAEAFESGSVDVADRCQSALQTSPFVVQNRESRISKREPDIKAPATRTMLGQDSDGALHAIFFLSPIHLAVAAQILLAPKGEKEGALTVSGSTAQGVTAINGLGLTDVVNLDGDVDSTGVLAGQVLAGDIRRDLPSLIIIAP